MERRLVSGSGIRCFFFPMSPPRSFSGVMLLVFATVRSLVVIARWRPRATVATGGYVCTPVALASWLLRIPVVLFLPDIVPGEAVRRLAPLARRIAVATDGSLPYLPGSKTVVTGYPVRDVFLRASRDAGRSRFELPDDLPVLCVFGGSQGSRSINQALGAALPILLDRYSVLHICGEQRIAEAEVVAASLRPEQRRRYRLFSYLHDQDMADALAAADLAVCRAGASVLGELPLMGTPAILVPLPEPGVHQYENAEFLEGAGAAIVLEDEALKEGLVDLVDEVLGNPERRMEMSNACRKLAKPDAAERIAALVMECLT